MTQAARGSLISSFPSELHLQILTFCPDVFALRSLALSCKPFYFAFKLDQDKLTKLMASRLVHPDVQHEADMAMTACRIPYGDPEAAIRFIEDHLNPRDMETPVPHVSRSWSMEDAMLLSHMHRHVTYFSETIPHKLLGGPPFSQATDVSTSSTLDTSRPSTNELHRFQRALYIFEMLRHLLARENSYRRPEIGSLWLNCNNRLADYAVEQQRCLNDYFTLLIAHCFNDLAQHDVTWGYLGVRLITSETSALGRPILSRGLEALHMLSEATTYGDRRRILHNGDPREGEPIKVPNPHPDMTLGYDRGDITHQVRADFLDAMLSGRSMHMNQPPFGQDPDLGPARVRDIVSRGQRSIPRYRRWGYVFWDDARLQQLGVFEDGWDQDGILAPEDGFLVYKALDSDEEALEKSRSRRREIWEKGGSGWWSPDDESKVVYSPLPKEA